MGQDLVPEQTPESVRAFTKALLTDLTALERMLAEEMFESGVRRIGERSGKARFSRTVMWG